MGRIPASRVSSTLLILWTPEKGFIAWVGPPDVGCISYLQDAQEFSDVERAIETLIKNFHNYSVEGKKETLTPAELRDLVTQQLPHLMPVLGEWSLSIHTPNFPS